MAAMTAEMGRMNMDAMSRLSRVCVLGISSDVEMEAVLRNISSVTDIMTAPTCRMNKDVLKTAVPRISLDVKMVSALTQDYGVIGSIIVLMDLTSVTVMPSHTPPSHTPHHAAVRISSNVVMDSVWMIT